MFRFFVTPHRCIAIISRVRDEFRAFGLEMMGVVAARERRKAKEDQAQPIEITRIRSKNRGE
jgi:hypothetical protein